MEEVGIELWLMIERLAKKSPSSLMKEVCCRTNEMPPYPLPTAGTNTPNGAKSALKESLPYQSLKERYQHTLKAQHSAFNLKGIRASLIAKFPNGLCLAESHSEAAVVRFVQSGAEAAIGEASARLNPAQHPWRYPSLWQVFGQLLTGTSLTSDELVDQIERIIILPNIIPQKWWHEDVKGLSSVYTLTKVAMLKDPATMELQYETRACNNKAKVIRGRRVLHLEEEIDSMTPPAALALIGRKLAQSHGFLFRGVREGANGGADPSTSLMENSILRRTSADAELLKWLTKLHQLVKFGRVTTPSKGNFSPSSTINSAGMNNTLGSSAAGGGGGNNKPPFPTAAQREKEEGLSKTGAAEEPQKADVGLLYRDPDAALRNVDLNSADDYTIQEFKAKMSEGFAAKVIKPGDPGYKYDVRVEIKPTAASEWDSD